MLFLVKQHWIPPMPLRAEIKKKLQDKKFYIIVPMKKISLKL